jgi:hypothetical protein
MKNLLLTIIISLVAGNIINAQSDLWMEISESRITLVGDSCIIPDSYRTVKIVTVKRMVLLK